jgi:hypothetical protein
MLLLGFVAVLGYPTNMNWWSFLLAVAISFLFALPIGIIQAVTNTQIGLNVLTEFIYGYIQPGRPLALMMYVLSTSLLDARHMLTIVQIQDIRLHHHVSSAGLRIGP